MASPRLITDIIYELKRRGYITLLQIASGAVARTMEDRMRDSISVMDFMSTAQKADVRSFAGSIDVSAAIAAAIAFAALTSRVVYFPAGRYNIASTLNVPAGVLLLGEGRGGTVNTTPTTGTILYYTGTGDGASLNGTLAGMQNLALIGTVAALGAGVLVNGDGTWYERGRR